MINNPPDRSPTVPFDRAALRRVTGYAFAPTVAYTVAARGGLDLVLHALRADGCLREADRLVDASQPLVEAVGADGGLLGLPDALMARKGGPSRVISSALRCDEMETALAAAFRALGWEELLPSLSAWSPSANRALEGVVLSADGEWDRRRLVVDVARRALEIERAWLSSPDMWSWSVLPVDGRTAAAAARVLGLPVGGRVARSPDVPLASRHANRLGRSVVALGLSRLPAALAGHAPQEVMRRALSLLGAVAEALVLPPEASSAKHHVVHVPPVGAPVRQVAWTPAMWWPVFDAWGSSSKQVAASTSTAWKLPPVDGDVVVWALAYAVSWLAVCSEVPGGRLSDAQWSEHVASSLDPVWGLRMESAWELFQSTRPVSSRAPWPSPFGSVSALSVVDLAAPASLPWVSESESSE